VVNYLWNATSIHEFVQLAHLVPVLDMPNILVSFQVRYGGALPEKI
jgi:hypothetical protein